MNVYYNNQNSWFTYIVIYGIIFLLLLGIGYYLYNYISVGITVEESPDTLTTTPSTSTLKSDDLFDTTTMPPTPPPVPVCPSSTREIDGTCYGDCPSGFKIQGIKECYNEMCPDNEDFTTSGNACIPRQFKTEYEDSVRYCPEGFNMIRDATDQHKCQGGCPNGFPYQYGETCFQPCPTFTGKPHEGAHTRCYFLDLNNQRVKDQNGNNLLIHNPNNVLSTSAGHCPPDFPHRYGSYCYRGCDQFVAAQNGGDHQCKLRSGSTTTIFDNPNKTPRLLQEVEYKCRDPQLYEPEGTTCYLKCHNSSLARIGSKEGDYRRKPMTNDCITRCPKGSYGLSNDRCSKKQVLPRPTQEKILISASPYPSEEN